MERGMSIIAVEGAAARAGCCRSRRRAVAASRLLFAILLVIPAMPVPAADGTDAPGLQEAPVVMPFSAGTPGTARPRGWEVIRLSDRKALTNYDLVSDPSGVVLRARAEASASVLAYRTTFDVGAAPMASWRWKVSALIPGADAREAGRDDSPVRVLFAFDGNKSRLSLGERAMFLLTKATGHELPYATLMYVWANDLAVGTVLPNPHTRRVQMIVAASGSRDVGQWRTIRRNLVEDFRRAFHEEPGRLVAVGVMTDTDNTGARTESWYGDIELHLPDR
jgi:hypothetical protein